MLLMINVSVFNVITPILFLGSSSQALVCSPLYGCHNTHIFGKQVNICGTAMEHRFGKIFFLACVCKSEICELYVEQTYTLN